MNAVIEFKEVNEIIDLSSKSSDSVKTELGHSSKGKKLKKVQTKTVKKETVKKESPLKVDCYVDAEWGSDNHTICLQVLLVDPSGRDCYSSIFEQKDGDKFKNR